MPRSRAWSTDKEAAPGFNENGYGALRPPRSLPTPPKCLPHAYQAWLSQLSYPLAFHLTHNCPPHTCSIDIGHRLCLCTHTCPANLHLSYTLHPPPPPRSVKSWGALGDGVPRHMHFFGRCGTIVKTWAAHGSGRTCGARHAVTTNRRIWLRYTDHRASKEQTSRKHALKPSCCGIPGHPGTPGRRCADACDVSDPDGRAPAVHVLMRERA